MGRSIDPILIFNRVKIQRELADLSVLDHFVGLKLEGLMSNSQSNYIIRASARYYLA